MARVEGTVGGGQVDNSATQTSFSDSTKSALENTAKNSGAFDDKKIDMKEVADIRSQLEESSPDAAAEIGGMSDAQLKTELEKSLAGQVGGAEEAPKGAEEKKPEEAGKGAGEEKKAEGAGKGGGEEKKPEDAGKGGGEAAPQAASPLDINQDGKIDEKDLALLMKKYDKNGDGKLDKKEMAAMAKDLGMDAAELEKKLDKDGDGEATKGEIGEAIKAEGESSGADANGGGEEASLTASNDISSFLQAA